MRLHRPPHDFGRIAAALLSFSGAPLFMLFNISTSTPEPMQEAVSAFGTSGVAATCSTTECCCCTIPPMTSAAFAAAFLSFSGALLLNNMSTSLFAGCPNRKCHYDGAYDCEPFRVRCRVRDFISQRFRASHHPFDLKSAISLSRDCFVNKNCFVKKNLDNCRAARRELLKNLSRVVFRSQNGRQRSAPESSPHEMKARPENPDDAQRDQEAPGRAGAFKESFNRLGIKVH